MNEEIKRIPCPKCGELMNASSRYCIRCGTINPNFESNKIVQKAIKQSIDSYKTGQSPLIREGDNNIAIASNTGNRKFAFLVTYLLYVGIILIIGLVTYLNGINTFDFLIVSTFPMTVVVISLFFLYIYSIELIFMKCNKPWWGGLVPIYNVMVLGDIAFHNKYIGLITLLPVIGPIFMLVIFYKLGEKFKYNKVLTALLSVIYIPIIGFADHLYEGKVYINTKDDRSLEKDYRNKKIFFGTIIVFLLAGGTLFVMGNLGNIRKTHKSIRKSYYVLASNKFLDKVKKAVDEDRITCDKVTYSSTQGIYYIKYADLGDNIYLPFYMMRDPISAYVKIDNNQDPRVYSVSMTDGTNGFKETVETEISTEIVVDYPTLVEVPKNNMCTISQ